MHRTLAVLGGIAAVVAAVALIWGATYYLGIFNSHVKASSARHTATNRVLQSVFSTGNARGSYEFFFQTCNDVLAENQQLDAAKTRVAALRSMPDDQFGTKAPKVADAISDVTGIEQLRAQTAADYNAAASEYTHNPFLDASLPTSITPPYDVTCS